MDQRRIKARSHSKSFKAITTYKMGLQDGFNFNRQEWFEDKDFRKNRHHKQQKQLKTWGRLGKNQGPSWSA